MRNSGFQKKSRLFLSIMIGLITVMACQTKVDFTGHHNHGSATNPNKQPTNTPSPEDIGPVLLIDQTQKTVTIKAVVNGTYLNQPTYHIVVYEEGDMGYLSIFRSLANQMDFYRALIGIGAQTKNTYDSTLPPAWPFTNVEGDLLKITISWTDLDGKIHFVPLEEAVTEITKDGSPPKGVEIRFGGNEKRSPKVNSGCLTCFYSCPVGITSNARRTMSEEAKVTHPDGSNSGYYWGVVSYQGRADRLPSDGTVVSIIYRLVK